MIKALTLSGVHRDLWNYPSDYMMMGACSNAFSLVRKERYDEVRDEHDKLRKEILSVRRDCRTLRECIEQQNQLISKLQQELRVAKDPQGELKGEDL